MILNSLFFIFLALLVTQFYLILFQLAFCQPKFFRIQKLQHMIFPVDKLRSKMEVKNRKLPKFCPQTRGLQDQSCIGVHL